LRQAGTLVAVDPFDQLNYFEGGLSRAVLADESQVTGRTMMPRTVQQERRAMHREGFFRFSIRWFRQLTLFAIAILVSVLIAHSSLAKTS
jgi:hypothetical protein